MGEEHKMSNSGSVSNLSDLLAWSPPTNPCPCCPSLPLLPMRSLHGARRCSRWWPR